MKITDHNSLYGIYEQKTDNNVSGRRGHKRAAAGECRTTSETEERATGAEKETEEAAVWTEDCVEISEEGRLAAEQEENTQASDGAETVEQEKDSTSTQISGSVTVNEGKRARQIAAAQSREQIGQVMALLQRDMADCRAGLQKGWCDESEIAKVEALINKAMARRSELPQKTEDSMDELAFHIASLM